MVGTKNMTNIQRVWNKKLGDTTGIYNWNKLLPNTVVSDEVKQQQRNLIPMWFDYRKAFDSVSYERTIQALHFTEVGSTAKETTTEI